MTTEAVVQRIGVLFLRRLHLDQDKDCEILLRLDGREEIDDTVDETIIALIIIAVSTSEAMRADGTR